MRKTIVITGATGGIGQAAAAVFARRGHDLILQGRDVLKGKRMAAELSVPNGGTVRFIAADVSTIAGIKALAAEIKQLTNQIALLIQATGTLNQERHETRDGLYESFAVNYVCKFMLDHLLLDELKRGQGRVIIVGGPIRKRAAIDFDDLSMQNGYSLMKSIGQNMLAIHLHAQEFSKRYGNIIPINITNAGVVKTGIDRNIKGAMKLVFKIFGPIIGNSVEKAIVNVIALAATDSKDSGYFYPKIAAPETKEKINLDEALAAKLWDESLKIAELNT